MGIHARFLTLRRSCRVRYGTVNNKKTKVFGEEPTLCNRGRSRALGCFGTFHVFVQRSPRLRARQLATTIQSLFVSAPKGRGFREGKEQGSAPNGGLTYKCVGPKKCHWRFLAALVTGAPMAPSPLSGKGPPTGHGRLVERLEIRIPSRQFQTTLPPSFPISCADLCQQPPRFLQF